jgi:HEPN domain-containing protein
MTPKSQEKKFDPAYAHELLKIAAGDIESAIVIGQSQKARIENAFYMLQQAIEKSLKAVLVHKGISIPLIHDLGALLAKLPDEVESPYGYELNELNQYATVRRYEEGRFQPTQEELASVTRVAKDMLSWARGVVK